MTIYTRKDRACKARVIAITGDSILITAFWPTVKSDDRNKVGLDGVTRNTLNVSKSYFERRYGKLEKADA